MSEVLYVKALEQLERFRNDKNIIEIAIRGKNRKFKAFQKIALDKLQDEKAQEALQNVAAAVKKNNILQAENLKKLEHLAKLNNIGILLNGLNLCATCAGFAMVLSKLDEMSNEIDQAFEKLKQDIKNMQDVNTEQEYREVLLEHQNMLDKKRINKPYDEDKMRKLVDDEYNVLTKLLDMLEKNISNDNTQLICLIITMASMLTFSLIEFDELYYFNNKEVLGEDECWHLSHDQWMNVYERLSSEWMIEKLQDNGLFDMNLDTVGVDMYYEEFQEQVEDMKQEVQDNDELISTIDDPELLQDLKEYNNNEFLEDIKESVEEVGAGVDDPEFITVCENAAEQVAQAY